MRTIAGRVLIGLGGFLLLIGLFGLVWAPGQVKKTPLAVDTVTHLSGVGGKVDSATGQVDSGPIVATSITKTDSKAGDDNVVVFISTSCLMKDVSDPPDCVDGDDPRLIDASQSVFPENRVSAVAVKNGKYVPAGTEQLEGLVNKWPFDATKKTYPYWDGTLGSTVDAVYDREQKVGGVNTYVYKVTIDQAPIEVIEGVPGTYTDTKEIYVEPLTGAVVNQTDVQERKLDDGTVALQLQLAFTAEQQKTSSDEAKDNVAKIHLLTRTVPIVGIVGGLLALAGGLFLLLVGRRREDDGDDVYEGKRSVSLES